MSEKYHPGIIAFCKKKLTTILLVFGLVVMTAGAGAWADSKSKHDEVLKFLQSEGILPFQKVYEIVKEKTGGEIIETEFEYEHGVPMYEFKYISKAGRVREVYVDARTGAIIKDKLD